MKKLLLLMLVLMEWNSLKAGQTLYKSALPKTGYMNTGEQFYKPSMAPTRPNYGTYNKNLTNYNQFTNAPANAFTKQSNIFMQQNKINPSYVAAMQYSTKPAGQQPIQTNSWWNNIKDTFKRMFQSEIAYKSGIDKELYRNIKEGDTQKITQLIKKGIDINRAANDIYGYSFYPLIMAVKVGNPEVVRLLIANGANVNIIPGLGNYPALIEAIKKGNQDIVSSLLHAGANVNTIYLGTTPLREAIIKNNPDLVRDLLVAGANVNQAGDGRTPLHLAIHNSSDSKIIEMLLDSGADPTRGGEYNSPMEMAIENGDALSIKRLIDRGIDPNISFNKMRDYTPIEFALHKGRQWSGYYPIDKVLSALVSKGADINRLHNGKTPLGLFSAYPELIATLVKHGARIDDPINSNGETLLTQAIKMGDAIKVVFLLELGAKANIKDKDGKTPMDYAIASNNSIIIELLKGDLGQRKHAEQESASFRFVPEQKNYYEILGVSKKATDVEIKTAYKKLAIKYHPDKNPDNKEAEKRFKEINVAHEILSNPNKRAAYDGFNK